MTPVSTTMGLNVMSPDEAKIALAEMAEHCGRDVEEVLQLSVTMMHFIYKQMLAGNKMAIVRDDNLVRKVLWVMNDVGLEPDANV